MKIFQREQRSLFGEILDWMLTPLLLLWPVGLALTWLVAQGIANKPFDRALIYNAHALAQLVTVQRGKPLFNLPQPASEILRADDSDTVYYQVLGPRGEWLSGERDLPPPPEEETPLPGDVRLRDAELRGVEIRVAYIWVRLPVEGSPMALVQVAETREKRSMLATEIIKGVMVPQFVLLPLAVLLVWLALARGIAPLNELQRRIRSRDSSDLSPIDERRIPDEVAPLVHAINDLLQRLDQSLSTQKHFLADAAHQLKTPLAGLRTQAELAQREIDEGRSSPQELRRSLQQIALSSQRAAHMVNQLLAMARAEDQEHASRRSDINLPEIAMETVRDFVPRALDKRLDLGYEGPDDEHSSLRILGHPILIRELIRNLVDNALLYTPPGGTITVRIVEDPFGQVCVLQVEDSGPGIAEAEREQVFQPFYRALGTNVDGSGLGLAIVREIAQQHEAELTLDDARPRRPGFVEPDGMGPGARFTIRFHAHPAAAPEAGSDGAEA